MDDHQDIARSSYADMLHDDERNHAYYTAIKVNINHLVKSTELNPGGERYFKCCDIGTGSGLLSMMIVQTFRDLNYKHFHVTAFEAFKPMAECARKVIAANGMSEEITVIASRSEECESNPQFDLLVAELLDTELIGEGCLLTYRHAVQNLCSPDCIFIPSEAHIYIQPLNCEQLFVRNNLRPSAKLKVEERWLKCPGLAEIDDMQLSQVDKSYQIEKLSPPQRVFSFQFNQMDSLKLRDTTKVEFELPSEDNKTEFLVIGMWWDIVMHDEALYAKYLKSDRYPHSFGTLSCAPNWHRREQYSEQDRYIELTYGREVWREHWIQGIYYLRNITNHHTQLQVHNGTNGKRQLAINAHHDSHSLWFNLALPDGEDETRGDHFAATCNCGIHRELSRSEMAFLASKEFERIYQFPALKGCDESGSNMGTMSLELNASRYQANSDESIDNEVKYRALHTMPNGSSHFHAIYQALQDEVSYARVMDNLIKGGSELAHPIARLSIKCRQVCFKSLNRIRTKVGRCQGFDLSHLDELIEYSAHLVDASTEAHNLVEYEHATFPDEPAIELLSLEQNSFDGAGREYSKYQKSEKIFEFRIPANKRRQHLKQGWALIFWPDLYLKSNDLKPTSLCDSSSKSTTPFKHLVHFLHDHPALNDTARKSIKLKIDIDTGGIRVTQAD